MPPQVDAAEEMEEAPKIPTDHDCGRFQSDDGEADVCQHASMEIDLTSCSSLRNEPSMVQGTWSGIFA